MKLGNLADLRGDRQNTEKNLLTHLGCNVGWHDGEEEVLLVLPLALQHDPGLDRPPCLPPVQPPLGVRLSPGEVSLAEPAQEAAHLHTDLPPIQDYW